MQTDNKSNIRVTFAAAPEYADKTPDNAPDDKNERLAEMFTNPNASGDPVEELRNAFTYLSAAALRYEYELRADGLNETEARARVRSYLAGQIGRCALATMEAVIPDKDGAKNLSAHGGFIGTICGVLLKEFADEAVQASPNNPRKAQLTVKAMMDIIYSKLDWGAANDQK